MSRADFYGALQWLLDVLGLPVDLTGLAGDDLGPLWALLVVVWLVFVPLQIIRWWSGRTLSHELLDADMGGLPFAHFLLLLLPIALADLGEGTVEALKELATSKLPEIAPVAVLTQMSLTLLFWLAFTQLLGVRWHTRLTPLLRLLSQLASLGTVFVVTMAWLDVAPFRHDTPVQTGALVAGAIVLPIALQGIAYHQPEEGESRWARLLVPPGWLLWRSVRAAIGYAGIGALLTLPFYFGAFPPPSFAAVLRVEVFVLSISFLLWGNRWTESMLDEENEDIPPELPRFVHLSLALSATAAGVAALPETGPTGIWLLAVGLPLLFAVVLYLLRVNRSREHTDRWLPCLLAALAGAVLVIPVKLALTAVFTSLGISGPV